MTGRATLSIRIFHVMVFALCSYRAAAHPAAEELLLIPTYPDHRQTMIDEATRTDDVSYKSE